MDRFIAFVAGAALCAGVMLVGYLTRPHPQPTFDNAPTVNDVACRKGDDIYFYSKSAEWLCVPKDAKRKPW